MTEAVRWNVDVIITDTTQVWLDLRRSLESDYDKSISQYSRLFLWTSPKYYTPFLSAYSLAAKKYLENVAGPFDNALPTIRAAA
ncbi:hypothetical protein NMY22_g14867 [Coprinellus aureogranulatus]|nr:hypothetical protein NMY22_g14867 [Coprinellus aureogranulatus]